MHSSHALGRRRGCRVALSGAAATVVLLALAACSSGGTSAPKSSSGPAGGGGGSSAAATGGEIKIGFTNQTAGSLGTYPEVTAAFDAAVSYINTELGGVGGKKITLDKCVVDGTPATTQKCAQQMVQDKPNFVMWGNDYNALAAWPILKAAGIFVIGELPLTNADFSATNVAFFNPGTAGSGPGTAAYIAQHPLPNKKFATLVSQNPAALAAAQLLDKPLKDLGYSTQDAAVSPTATDYTSSLLSVHPQAVGGLSELLAANGCVAFANAYGQQGLKTQVYANQTCYAPDVLKSSGKYMVGWKVTELTQDPSGTTADAVTYRKAMSSYGGTNYITSGQAALAFSTMMTTYNNVLKPLASSQITSSSVQQQLSGSGKSGPIFLGGKYTCGVVKALPSVCGTQLFIYDIGPGPDYKLQVDAAQPGAIDITSVIERSFPNHLG
jgi:branched-chain amino acid transport system substrate-binding protein